MGRVHKSDKCVICLDATPQFVCKPCMHKCICNGCKDTYFDKTTLCPMCRQEVGIDEKMEINRWFALLVVMLMLACLFTIATFQMNRRINNLREDILYPKCVMGPSGPRGPPGHCDENQVREIAMKCSLHKKLEEIPKIDANE